MKKFLVFIFLLGSYLSYGQAGNDTTKYVWYKYTYGNRLQRYWADSVLDIPHDTTFSKYGIARKAGVLYVGDGTRWRAASSGGGGGTDTVLLYQIGTAAGQIETLYAVDGNLRKSRWVPGYGTLPFLAPDSAAYIDIDTNSIAYKSWVIQQFGTSVNNLQQVIDNGNKLTRHDSIIGSGLYALTFDSLLAFIIKDNSGADWFSYNSTTPGVSMGDFQGSNNFTSFDLNDATKIATIRAQSGLTLALNTNFITTNTNLKSQTTGNTARDLYLPDVNAVDTIATLSDVRAGGGGGGSSTATIQTITSGTSGTVTGSNYWVRFNPASALATYTLTLPASPTVGQSVTVIFGGTITAGTVVTAFTVAPNTSQSILDNTPPAGSSVTVDNAFEYLYIATNLWVRKKL